MDPIDRDEAIKRINHQRVVDKSVARRILYTMPTVKSEIIHCKDCKYLEEDTVFHQYWCRGNRVFVSDDHYCGYAEKREETEQ